MEKKRLLIKIGSNVLTQNDGFPDEARMAELVRQFVELWRQGYEVIVVSSGAVAFGRSMIRLEEARNSVQARQLLSAVGQVRLMGAYEALFSAKGIRCAQVLVTKEDFRDRSHYLHMRSCLETLIAERVIPVINENDVISVTELMFTDNDELAGLVAGMLNVDELLILSNVDGIYRDYQDLEKRELLLEVPDSAVLSSMIVNERSSFGRGGMLTKATTAGKVAGLGIPVRIANGKKDNAVLAVLAGEQLHSQFLPQRKLSGRKKWIARSAWTVSGKVQINAGALVALKTGGATSLLPVGILAVEVDFQKGDLICLTGEDEQIVGWGIARYSSLKAREYIGQQHKPLLVHYDHLYMEP